MALTAFELRKLITERLGQEPLTPDFKRLLESIRDNIHPTEPQLSFAANLTIYHRWTLIKAAVGSARLDHLSPDELTRYVDPDNYRDIIKVQREWLIGFLQQFDDLDFSHIVYPNLRYANPLLILTKAWCNARSVNFSYHRLGTIDHDLNALWHSLAHVKHINLTKNSFARHLMTDAEKQQQIQKLVNAIVHFHSSQTLDLSDNYLAELGIPGLQAIIDAVARVKIMHVNLGNNGYEDWDRKKITPYIAKLLQTLERNRQQYWKDETLNTDIGIDLNKPRPLANHPVMIAVVLCLATPLLVSILLLAIPLKLLECIIESFANITTTAPQP